MRSRWSAVTWALAGLAAVLALALPLVTTGRAAILPVLLLAAPVALIDGVRRYGWMAVLPRRDAGDQQRLREPQCGDRLPVRPLPLHRGPQLVHVPIYIGPVYVGLGYLCWRLAGLILAGRRLTDAGGKSPPDTSSAVDLAPNGVVMCMAACCPVGGAPRWRGRTPPTSR
ncbi:hypothetical protein Jiend_52030 [Micromonospora endophytica]|nr:hypothetical protein Jiend_52030 [Micromonospora endophytica]